MPKAKPPSFIDKVNFLIDYLVNPCQAPYYILIETALPPAGNTVIELLSFSLDDVVRGFIRPKGLRSGRHGRKSRKHRSKYEIPEIGEMIGEHLPGAEQMKARKVGNGVKWMYFVDELEQRALFWWMVVDLTSDFFYDWCSAIVQSDDSDCPLRQRGHRQALGGYILGGLDFNLAFFNTIVYINGGLDMTPFDVTFDQGDFSLTASMTVRLEADALHDHVNFGIRLRSGHTVWDTAFTRIDRGETGQVLVSASLAGPGECVVEVVSDNYTVTVIQGDFTVIGRGKERLPALWS